MKNTGSLGVPVNKTVKSMKSIPPQMQVPASIQTDEKRARLVHVLSSYSDCVRLPPVQSNAELLERGERYFKYCAEQQLYPTFEGLATFLGYSHGIYQRWIDPPGGQQRFPDGFETTSDILKRLRAIIEAIDGDLASGGDIPPVPWIFRRKATSGWKETTEVELKTHDGPTVPDALSPEEVARYLPDLGPADDGDGLFDLVSRAPVPAKSGEVQEQ